MNEERKRMSREDRRDTILKEAIRVFGDLGYHNATTSELAKAAGISEALLYQHFPSKQALLIACIETLGNEIYDGLYELLRTGQQDPGRTFEGLYQRLFRFMVGRSEINRFSLVLLSELEEPEIATAIRALLERAVTLLTRALRRGQERGALRKDQDPEMMSYMLVGMFQLFGLLQRLGILERIHREGLSRLVDAFLP